MSATNKTLENTTGSAITLSEVGLDIAASTTYTMTLDEYLRFASPAAITEITTHINSGDIVVNDGTNDLAAADAIRFLKYPDRAYIQEEGVDVVRVAKTFNFEGDVDIVNDGGGKATITVGETGQFTGKLADFVFVASGNTADKWLGIGNGSTASNTLPLILAQDCDLTAITFSNQDDNVDIDVELYVNGVLDFTWEVRNKRTAWKTDAVGLSTYSQGDRLSCFLRRYSSGTGDDTAQDPAIEVFIVYRNDNVAEGGTQYGV